MRVDGRPRSPQELARRWKMRERERERSKVVVMVVAAVRGAREREVGGR